MKTTAERLLTDLGFQIEWVPKSKGVKMLAIKGTWSFGFFISELMAGVYESSVNQQVVAEVFTGAKFERNEVYFPLVVKFDETEV